MGRPKKYNTEEEIKAAKKEYYRKQKQNNIKYCKSGVIDNAINRIKLHDRYKLRMLKALGKDDIMRLLEMF